MKFIKPLIAIMLFSQVSFADSEHPVLANYNKTVSSAYEYLLHNAGYSAADFNNLVGASTQQDLTRKIRLIRFRFAQTNCAKDIEVYAKLDGSAILANKVVGCVP